MAIPKYDEMYGLFLKEIEDGEIHLYKDIRGNIAKKLNLTDEELSVLLPSGKQTIFDNRLGWTRTYLKKAGLIDSPSRAQFVLSDEGKQALSEIDSIDNNYLRRYKSFQAFIDRSKSADVDVTLSKQNDDKSPDELLETAFKALNSSLEDDLMAEIMKLTPADFEGLCMMLLRKMNYGSGLDSGYKVTPLSKDGGIDGYIEEDPLGCRMLCYQAKQWDPSKTVNSPEIHQFSGAINAKGKDLKGVFITTAKFSSGARDDAEKAGIVLVDGEKMIKLMIKYNLGVSIQYKYEVKNVDTDFFNNMF